jgi:pimeloyl-ACP methyl ester carboxylesterase
MAYWEWGNPDNPRVVVCVHGLTRTGRDFDLLARHLASHYRVVCPDVVGRGRSDWLATGQGYVIPQYVADMVTLVARLRPAQLDWVGTSMGGLIGLSLAGALATSPALLHDRGPAGLGQNCNLAIGKMVLNDVGPALNYSGLERIATYVGRPGWFDTFDEAVEYVKSVSAGFGQHDRQGWEDLTRYVMIEQNGRWVKHYDLRIAEPFSSQTPEVMAASEAILWNFYDSLSQPLLIVRGQQSDLLTEQTAQQMLERGRNARLYTVPDTGHAPSLRSADQIQAVADFLLQQPGVH